VEIVSNPVGSSNRSKLLQLVSSSCNQYNIIVAIGLVSRLQLVYTQIQHLVTTSWVWLLSVRNQLQVHLVAIGASHTFVTARVCTLLYKMIFRRVAIIMVTELQLV
jgi:hypothetical protein